MRVIVAALGLTFVSAVAGAEQAAPSGDAVPELVVWLEPSTGVVPLDVEEQFAPYTFSVHAFDRESRRRYAAVQLFIRLGQTRLIDKGNDETRIRGSVELKEDGSAKYRVELSAYGKTVARTSAVVRVVPAR